MDDLYASASQTRPPEGPKSGNNQQEVVSTTQLLIQVTTLRDWIDYTFAKAREVIKKIDEIKAKFDPKSDEALYLDVLKNGLETGMTRPTDGSMNYAELRYLADEEVKYLEEHKELPKELFEKESQKIGQWNYYKEVPKLNRSIENVPAIVSYAEVKMKEYETKIKHENVEELVKKFEETVREKYQTAYSCSGILQDLYTQVKMAEISGDEKVVQEAIDKFYQEADKVKEEVASIEERREKALKRFNDIKDRFLKVRNAIESSNSEDKLFSLMDLAPIEDRIGIVEWYHVPNLTNSMIYSLSKSLLVASIDELEERLDEIEKQFSVVLERMEEKYELADKKKEEEKEEKGKEPENQQPADIQHEVIHMIPSENQQQPEQKKDWNKTIIEHFKKRLMAGRYTKPDYPPQDLFYFLISNIDLNSFTEEDFEEYQHMFFDSLLIGQLTEEQQKEYLQKQEEYKQKLLQTKPKNIGFKPLAIKYIIHQMPTEKDWKNGSTELVRFVIEDTDEDSWTFELYQAFKDLLDQIIAMPEDDMSMQQQVEGFKDFFKKNAKQIEK